MRFTSPLVVLLLANALGCSSAAPDEATASTKTTEDALFAASHYLWPDTTIPVCWLDLDGTDPDARAWTRDAVATSWEAVSPIRFVGWGQCGAGGRGIRIKVEDAGPVSYVGTGSNGQPFSMLLNFTFGAWGNAGCSGPGRREHCTRGIAIHEFGHALGFDHEQNRSDTPSSCPRDAISAGGDTVIGPWDPQSVMNYCNVEWANGLRLSAIDVLGVQTLYGPAPEGPTDARVFDARTYLDLYPDLRAAFGDNGLGAAARHWAAAGRSEGRTGSLAMDPRRYLTSYGDLASAFGADGFAQGIEHFRANGIAEGRQASVVIDPPNYLARYPDLVAAFGVTGYAAALDHFRTHGLAEGRRGSADFDAAYYLAQNVDVARAVGVAGYRGAALHYLASGRAEGRAGAAP